MWRLGVRALLDRAPGIVPGQEPVERPRRMGPTARRRNRLDDRAEAGVEEISKTVDPCEPLRASRHRVAECVGEEGPEATMESGLDPDAAEVVGREWLGERAPGCLPLIE